MNWWHWIGGISLVIGISGLVLCALGFLGWCIQGRVSLLFAWYDLWVGAYWDRKTQTLYLFPVPMLGLKLDLSDDPDLREYKADLEHARSPLLSIAVNLSPSRRGTERHLSLHLPGPDKILRISQICYFNPDQARFVEAVAQCPNIRIEHTE